jgi:DNA-binding MarR family transcriptional regulator
MHGSRARTRVAGKTAKAGKHDARAADRVAPRTGRPPAAPQPGFAEGYLAALLARASHRISAEFHAVVRAQGIAVAEWRLLASLAEGDSIAVGRLARLVIAPQPTVTRRLGRMAAKGLVERLADADDRRLTLARITPAGQRLADALIAQAKAHERAVLARLAPGAASSLKAALRALIG